MGEGTREGALHLQSVRFGDFQLDLAGGELRRGDHSVPLQRLPFALLSLLLERRGELVTREAVRARLWPDGTHVDFEHGVNTALKKLRRALGDCPRRPRFVETLAGRGYRFVAPVEPARAPGIDALAPEVARALEPLRRAAGPLGPGLAERAAQRAPLSPDECARLRGVIDAFIALGARGWTEAPAPQPHAS
jgi:DNA-binding winged helix-turn-helix (wHTH) protein